MKNSNEQEWRKSGIAESLIKLNLKILTTDQIAEWFFQYLPHSARRNDGRIRDGYLRAYSNPLQGGWGIEGYDPTNLEAEPELRSFKPNNPRISKDGKVIRYDAPKNSRHNPILPRVSYEIASIICRQAGVNFLLMTQKYAPLELVTGVDDEAECRWFWKMILDNPQISITFTEGGKKCLALLSQGRCAVALTSITTWRLEKGSNKVHHWLALLAYQRRCFIAFDQDSKKTTIKAVNTQAFKLGNGLIKAGAVTVKRISWSGTAKGVDDFIYKTQKRYGTRYLQKILRKCYENARHYRLFNKSSSLPGKIKIVNKRYLDINDLKEAAGFKILVIKSAKGSGKTLLLSLLTAADRYSGIPTINLSYLERLSREQGIRSGIPYRTQKDSTSMRNAIGYSLCVDSFTPDNSVPFRPEEWADSGLTIDEFTQVFRHSAFGTTELKHYRALVLDTLAKKLADCWENDKPIRLLDADADPESMELVYELIQLYSDKPITREELEAKTFTLINEYRPKKGDCYFYNEPTPKQILCDLKKLMEKRKNLLVLSSAQKSRSADGTINLERKAQKYYKKSEILRIDSQTTKDPNHPAFGITEETLTKLIKGELPLSAVISPALPVKQLNLLEKEKVETQLPKIKLDEIKMVIASPTICTGISIEQLEGHFAGVFSFQAGNITPNSVRQHLVRLRDFQCPRYIWTPKLGKNFVGSKSTNPLELLTDQKGEAGLSFKLLGYRQAERLIENNICPSTKYWAKVGAQQNQENYHYREVVRAGLEDEGWV